LIEKLRYSDDITFMDSDDDEPTIVPFAELVCDSPGCTQKAPAFKCSRCRCTYYCSVDCQRNDWKRHKKEDCEHFETSAENAIRKELWKIPVSGRGRLCDTCEKDETSTGMRRGMIVLPDCEHAFCYRCLKEKELQQRKEADSKNGSTKFVFHCPKCSVDIRFGDFEDLEPSAEAVSLFKIDRCCRMLDTHDDFTAKEAEDMVFDALASFLANEEARPHLFEYALRAAYLFLEIGFPEYALETLSYLSPNQEEQLRYVRRIISELTDNDDPEDKKQ
jgi:hypothetical protein